MKRIEIILLISVAAVVLMQPAGAAVMSGDPVSVSAKDKNLFVVKTDRKFRGANIEIFSSNGERVTVQQMTGKKVVIYFGDVEQGVYTIRVSKGETVKEFQFEKR